MSLLRRLLLASSVAVFAAGCGSEEPSDGAGGEVTGAAAAAAEAPPAPELTAADTAGIREALAARRGQPLLVNLWAMWCVPCVAELPDLQKVQARMVAGGGTVLGINCELMAPGRELEQTLSELPAFLQERELTFPHLVYSDPDAGPLAELLDVPLALPVTLVFDASGTEVARHEGIATAEEFEELAATALGEDR